MRHGEVGENIPLAAIEGGTLTCSPTQDVYYITDEEGESKNVPLDKAAALFLRATDHGGVVWNEYTHVPGRRKDHQRLAAGSPPAVHQHRAGPSKESEQFNSQLDALLDKRARDLEKFRQRLDKRAAEESRQEPTWKRILQQELHARPNLRARLNLEDWGPEA